MVPKSNFEFSSGTEIQHTGDCIVANAIRLCLLFHPTASGPKQCNMCIEKNAAMCSHKQQTQVCATGPNSLGTTHCGSAVGKYRDRKKRNINIFIQGCINCAGK